ncbi:MAG: hypothetical protein AB1797_11175 [bacterium]
MMLDARCSILDAGKGFSIQESSIQNRASRIEHPESSIQDRGSRLCLCALVAERLQLILFIRANPC